TDITGFGLLGHLLEMLTASGVSAELHSDSVPLLPGAFELAAAGVVPGGTLDNADHTASRVDYDRRISRTQRMILNDAQTSGGLLISVASGEVDKLLSALHRDGRGESAVIGKIQSTGEPRIAVV
ncbi:MAG: hypothetical protein KAT30_07080, partial [Candidatus Krumholzibacteria bacterium]|nr:hypothetical protein [Candidatus Krumholzibacteria bacterium]